MLVRHAVGSLPCRWWLRPASAWSVSVAGAGRPCNGLMPKLRPPTSKTAAPPSRSRPILRPRARATNASAVVALLSNARGNSSSAARARDGPDWTLVSERGLAPGAAVGPMVGATAARQETMTASVVVKSASSSSTLCEGRTRTPWTVLWLDHGRPDVRPQAKSGATAVN